MTVHDLSPGFIIVFYNSNGHSHKHVIPISNPIDTGGGEYTVASKSGGAIDVDTAMAAWATACKPLFAAGSTLLYWELWTKAGVSGDPVFRETGDLSVVGTNGGAAVALSQVVASYRTSLGGIGKVEFLETAQAVNVVTKPVYAGGFGTWATYILGAGSIYAGRDEGFPVSIPKIVTKTNDALRKKYVLNV